MLMPFCHGCRQNLQNATCYVPCILLSPRPHSYIYHTRTLVASTKHLTFLKDLNSKVNVCSSRASPPSVATHIYLVNTCQDLGWYNNFPFKPTSFSIGNISLAKNLFDIALWYKFLRLCHQFEEHRYLIYPTFNHALVSHYKVIYWKLQFSNV